MECKKCRSVAAYRVERVGICPHQQLFSRYHEELPEARYTLVLFNEHRCEPGAIVSTGSRIACKHLAGSQ